MTPSFFLYIHPNIILVVWDTGEDFVNLLNVTFYFYKGLKGTRRSLYGIINPPAYLKNWSVYWSDTINIFCSKYLL
jgi:hypothetical protein